jgi:hypothetical protein
MSTRAERQAERRQDMRDKIAEWTHGEDWQTWVAHSVIALLIAVVAGVIGGLVTDGDGVIIGATAAIAYYLIRELEQVFYFIVDKKELHPFDHFMDVAAPAAVVGLLALIIEVLR